MEAPAESRFCTKNVGPSFSGEEFQNHWRFGENNHVRWLLIGRVCWWWDWLDGGGGGLDDIRRAGRVHYLPPRPSNWLPQVPGSKLAFIILIGRDPAAGGAAFNFRPTAKHQRPIMRNHTMLRKNSKLLRQTFRLQIMELHVGRSRPIFSLRPRP